jgi:hypothetical protein
MDKSPNITVGKYADNTSCKWPFLTLYSYVSKTIRGCHGKQTNHFESPEQYNEASEVVLNVFDKKTPFEVGKWYYSKYIGTERLIKFSHKSGDGTLGGSEAVINVRHHKPYTLSNPWVINSLEPATTEQIQLMLEKAAVKKGFVKGAKVNSTGTTAAFTITTNHTIYNHVREQLIISGVRVYEKGVWGNVIVQATDTSNKIHYQGDYVSIGGVRIDNFIIKDMMDLCDNVKYCVKSTRYDTNKPLTSINLGDLELSVEEIKVIYNHFYPENPE